ncbi:MAG: hypothetical protein EOO92_13110 [Pedobacter sp.]|nr:MAG: hypothetical protein EOO92_13110 [Pedobacter sp.]
MSNKARFFVYNTLIVTALILTLCTSCNSERTKQHTVTDTLSAKSRYELMFRLAGDYAVLSDQAKTDTTEELYVLRHDATAKWMLLKNDGDGGAHVTAESEGTWTVTPTQISVTTQKNGNAVTEDYQLKDSVYTEVKEAKRILKRY